MTFETTFIERYGLFDSYNQTLSWKITTLQAPPGSGKSSILKEWCYYYNQNVSSQTTAVLFDFSNQAIDLSLKLLNDEIVSQTSKNISDHRHFILIDGLDTIFKEHAEQFFCTLIKNSPGNLRFVLASAQYSGNFFAMLADANIQEVPISNIMFTREETARYVSQMLPNCPELLSGIDYLYEITEGWLMGIKLAIQSIQHYPLSSRFEDFDGQNEFVNNLFKLQVFDALPNDLVSFSYETALAKTLSPQLCDAMTGKKDSAFLLERICNLNPFLYKLSKTGLYKYNRLYANWLQSQLLQFTDSQIRTLATKASDWYKAQGDWINDMRMLILATDTSCLIPLLANSSIADELKLSSALYQYVLRVPSEKCSEDLLFCLLAVWVCIGFGQLDDLLFWQTHLKRVVPEFAEDSKEAEYYHLMFRICDAVTHAIVNHNLESIRLCEQILAEGNPILNPMMKFHIYYSLADAFERVNKLPLAIDYCLRANASAMAAGAVDSATLPNYKKCKILLAQGRFLETEEVAKASIQLTNDDSPLRKAFSALIALVQLETLQLYEAERSLHRALTNLSSSKNPEIFIEATLAKADYMTLQGDTDLAHEELLKTINLYETKNIPAAAMSFVYIALGKLSIFTKSVIGLSFAYKNLQKATSSEDLFCGLYVILFQAVLAFWEKRYGAAVKLFNQALQEAQSYNYNALWLEAAMQKAALHSECGDADMAQDLVREVLSLGIQLDCKKTIILAGKDFYCLLKQMPVKKGESNLQSEFLRSLFHMYNAAIKVNLSDNQLLTPREQEILRLLNNGKTRQEISDLLFISINTTKSHIKNIHRKLGY